MKMTKTMRYEIAYNRELYNVLSDVQYAVWRIKNKAASLAYDWQQFSFSYNERFGVYPKDKEFFGKTLSADIYGQVKHLGEHIASYTVDAATQQAVKKFKEDKPKIVRGEIAMTNYKRNCAFPIRAKQVGGLKRETAKKYTANIALLSKVGAKERESNTRFPIVLRTGNGANTILDRVITGEYKMCDSEIVKRKNKFYLMLAYQYECEHEKGLDRDSIMGVDIGVVNPTYMAFNKDKYARYAIEGGEIDSFRRKVEARRKSMLKQSKYCGRGRRGRGRKTLMKPTEKLRDKVENFRRTTNHKYSKYIVDMAVKHGCGTIQLEDLTGVNERSKFLKNWSYYELQSFIEYKARERGIKVVKINPKYTSQRCHECGHIDKSSRPTQETFKCTSCGNECHADFNAAKNIATPNIEWIIEETLKREKELAS